MGLIAEKRLVLPCCCCVYTITADKSTCTALPLARTTEQVKEDGIKQRRQPHENEISVINI